MRLEPGQPPQEEIFIDWTVILDRRNLWSYGCQAADRLLDPEHCVEHLHGTSVGIPFHEVGRRRPWHLRRQLLWGSHRDRPFTGQHVKTPGAETWKHSDIRE